jgi:hypothetical protein
MTVPALNRGGACTGPTLAVQARPAAGIALLACSTGRPASAQPSTGPAGARRFQHMHNDAHRMRCPGTTSPLLWHTVGWPPRRVRGGGLRKAGLLQLQRRCAALLPDPQGGGDGALAPVPRVSGGCKAYARLPALVLCARAPERTARGQQENVKAVVCAAEGCTTLAAYAYLGQQRQFCCAHKLDIMVRVVPASRLPPPRSQLDAAGRPRNKSSPSGAMRLAARGKPSTLC